MTPGAGAGASFRPHWGSRAGWGATRTFPPRLTAPAFGSAEGCPPADGRRSAFSAAAPHRAHVLTLRLLPVRPRPQTVRNHAAPLADRGRRLRLKPTRCFCPWRSGKRRRPPPVRLRVKAIRGGWFRESRHEVLPAALPAGFKRIAPCDRIFSTFARACPAASTATSF